MRTPCQYRAIFALIFAANLGVVPAAVITNDTFISAWDDGYDGQELVLSNCTVRLDGPHQFAGLFVGAGGSLIQDSYSGPRTRNFSITSEVHVISETNTAVLLNSNVLSASVVVTDVGASTTYTNDQDYVLSDAGGTFMGLQRTTNSVIPEGATIWVSYVAQSWWSAGVNVKVIGDVHIATGGTIKVSGQGVPLQVADSGRLAISGTNVSGGGGGHAGHGSSGFLPSASGGGFHGNVYYPTHPGGDGGGNTSFVGGAGGGCIRLNVGGVLQVDGTISADGNAPLSPMAGAGAGGSVWIKAGRLEGGGEIRAKGGSALSSMGGGGSGGRVAIYCGTNDFTGKLSAVGGREGFQTGAAGTIYTSISTAPAPVLLVDNGDQIGTNTVFTESINADMLVIRGGVIKVTDNWNCQNLTIGSNGFFALTSSGTSITSGGRVHIAKGGRIDATGLGFAGDSGPAAGGEAGSPIAGGGGGHGGHGGLSSSNGLGGTCYGSTEQPNTTGSGGGRGDLGNTMSIGGAGGGKIRISAEDVVVDGLLLANGLNGTNNRSGGGAGGSIWITAGNCFEGTGLIAANGGDGEPVHGGGGGGGRIAIESKTNLFIGESQAFGGAGFERGGAGTIFVKNLRTMEAVLELNNGGARGALTLISNAYSYDVVVDRAAVAYPRPACTLHGLTVRSNAWLTSKGAGEACSLTVLADARLEPGGCIDLAAKGSPYAVGPNQENPGCGDFISGTLPCGGGGGHAGQGGSGLHESADGGVAHGSLATPTARGSGGGGADPQYPGGYGGGAVRLDVRGNLSIDGLITSDGERARSAFGGGGSGGSVYITAVSLAGSGRISADGGSSFGKNGGGGSGGRIAVHSDSGRFDGQISAKGGAGFQCGAAGTIFVKTNAVFAPLVLLDNHGQPGPASSAAHNEAVNLVLEGGATVAPPATIGYLTIGSNCSLTLNNLSQTLTVTGNAWIKQGGSLSVSGFSATNSARGSYDTLTGSGGGGAHAGYGGYGSGGTNSAKGATAYDLLSNPRHAGSVGGGNTTHPGGNGGGAILLAVNGSLRLDGTISADGMPGLSGGAGGGAGGTLNLTLKEWTGSGQLLARGGDGHLPNGGGGGGGRIAVTCTTNAFAGTLRVSGGRGYTAGGSGTTYIKTSTNQFPQVIMDNRGLTNSAFSMLFASSGEPIVPIDFALLGGARSKTTNSYFRNVIIGSNSWWNFGSVLGSSFALCSATNLTIEKGGGLKGDGASIAPAPHIGMGFYTNNAGGGGGNVGDGGPASNGASGGEGHTTLMTLITRSAGSSGGGSTTHPGGAGGAAIAISVRDTFRLDGVVSVNGGAAASGAAGGGGGGYVSVYADRWLGEGAIFANGGSGHFPEGGGGGGGLISAGCRSNQFTGSLHAHGGRGATYGGAGLVHVKTGYAYPAAFIDNAGIKGASTFLATTSNPSLLITGAAQVCVSNYAGPLNLAGLQIHPGSWLTSFGKGIDATNYMNISGDARIWEEAGIDLSGRGSAGGTAANGRFAGTPNNCGGGGGHAGPGGMGLTNVMGGSYIASSIIQPLSAGGIGGQGSAYPGGGGGGAIRLNVMGNLQLDGAVAANGTPPLATNSGAGAGGSIWISAGKLSGGGIITAEGGDASGRGGAGSGGRIAVYYGTNSFSGRLLASGGTGPFDLGQNGAAGTIFTKTNGTTVGQLLIAHTDVGAFSTYLNSAGTIDLITGGDVWLQGASNFRNLTLCSNSTLYLYEPTNNISVSGDARIEAGAKLSVDGRNYASSSRWYSSSTHPEQNSGAGGGHGGAGGSGRWGGAASAGGSPLGDSFVTPEIAGVKGGGSSTNVGGSGGGLLSLIVNGLLHLDGEISANGDSASSGGAGGGAGGGINLDVDRWTGFGRLSANGGDGHEPNGGGGGGGRIAITYRSNFFSGSLSTTGGSGANRGGAGTVYLKSKANAIGRVYVDNGGLIGGDTVLNPEGTFSLYATGGASISNAPQESVTLRDLYIGSNAKCRFYGISQGSWSIAGNALIEPGGGISAEGLGYGATNGAYGTPGSYSSSASSSSGGGGGHGGLGGSGLYGGFDSKGGAIYFDSMDRPNTAGGGGGSYSQSPESAGGGTIRLNVAGLLELNGIVSADGAAGLTSGSGGGAGGSLWLDLGGLTGSGILTAKGGAGNLPNGGGGGGGRIALYYQSNSFAGTITARGGEGNIGGGAGTIYSKASYQPNGQVLVDNGGLAGTNTVIDGTGYELLVANEANLLALKPVVVSGLNVLSGGLILTTNHPITVLGDAEIQKGGAISADSLGSRPEEGVGAGSHTQNPRGGGSHGGLGGANPAATSFGDIANPNTFGSGGGNGSGSGVSPRGGSGGGAIRLNVQGSLAVDGQISANGGDGEANSGGGAGGSVWIAVRSLRGEGVIAAEGGDADGSAGGGGGGRISLQIETNLFTGSLQAFGGIGSVVGGAGTVYVENTEGLRTNKCLTIDNFGLTGASTRLQNLSEGLDLLVLNGGRVIPYGEFPLLDSVKVGSGGVISPGGQEYFRMGTVGNFTIEKGGVIHADGLGHRTGPGWGASLPGLESGGGGYGGAGGASANGAAGGIYYGSASQPVDFGSGGGTFSLQSSDGGGAIRLAVGGILEVKGVLSADGKDGLVDNTGGGSGGSIWLSAGSMTGDGTISADGGWGELFNGGGGGGGRIAVYSADTSYTGSMSVSGGFGAHPGQPGTIYTSSAAPKFNIVSHSPTGIVSQVTSFITLQCNGIISPASVHGDDFVIFTPAGLLSNINASASGPFSIVVNFPGKNLPGPYRIEAGPSLQGLFGEPLSQVYTGAFTVALATISGTVTNLAGQRIPNVIVQPEGDWLPAITDANGEYSLPVEAFWSGIVTPSLDGFVIVPGSRTYGGVAASIANEDFLVVETIVPELSCSHTGSSMLLSWFGLPAVNYELWHSTNLVDWFWTGDALPGTNGVMEVSAPRGTVSVEFFRLKASN